MSQAFLAHCHTGTTDPHTFPIDNKSNQRERLCQQNVLIEVHAVYPNSNSLSYVASLHTDPSVVIWLGFRRLVFPKKTSGKWRDTKWKTKCKQTEKAINIVEQRYPVHHEGEVIKVTGAGGFSEDLLGSFSQPGQMWAPSEIVMNTRYIRTMMALNSEKLDWWLNNKQQTTNIINNNIKHLSHMFDAPWRSSRNPG